MLNKEQIKELIFFAAKVADVHGPKHSEYIKINEEVKKIDFKNIDSYNFEKFQKLTNNYKIPEGACRAQTTLLSLLKQIDKTN